MGESSQDTCRDIDQPFYSIPIVMEDCQKAQSQECNIIGHYAKEEYCEFILIIMLSLLK